jgi:nucleotide-binding universal stress UspA family protein
MGAHGTNRIDRTLLGTTAEFILRSMPCAVMTIGPGTLFDDRKADRGSILLHASSLPEKPGVVLDYLRVLAKAYGASVEIIHVIDDFAKIRDHRAFSQLRTAGESLVGKLQQFDVNASLKLSCGHQSDVIIDRAEMIDASLIIFGLEHPTSSPYVTGVIGRTIQEASCPVLTVPGPA